VNRFDTVAAAEHPRSVKGFLRRVLATTLGLVLTGGPISLCAAATPTPEARMACCQGTDP